MCSHQQLLLHRPFVIGSSQDVKPAAFLGSTVPSFPPAVSLSRVGSAMGSRALPERLALASGWLPWLALIFVLSVDVLQPGA